MNAICQLTSVSDVLFSKDVDVMLTAGDDLEWIMATKVTLKLVR